MGKSLEEIVREVVGKHIVSGSASSIGLTDDLQDYGINSVSYMMIIVALESELGIAFDDERLDPKQFASIQSILDFLNSGGVL